MARLRRTPEVGSRLAEVGAVVWRHRMIVLLVAALTMVASLGWALARPTVFTASSRLLVPSLTAKEQRALTLAGLEGGIQQLSIETQAQLIGSPVVAAEVSEAIDGRISTEELTRAVDAEAVGPNQVLITARAPRADLAQAEANAFADAYLAYRAASRARDVSVVLQAVAEQRADIDRRIADADLTIEASMVGLSALPPMELADTEQQAASASLLADLERAETERSSLQESRLTLAETEAGLG
ncbi:MAG: Wzz/FepE/Etk N-terminal domain-containing protein, partial [Actinomycetota bacterium]